MNSIPHSRNPWPIAIIVFFLSFAGFVVSFTVFASRQRVDLVQVNYYECEMRYQEQIDAAQRAQSLAMSTSVTFEAQEGMIRISMPLEHTRLVTSGQVILYRPSDARLDHKVPLALNFAGVQRIDARSFLAGYWKVRVEWTAMGQEFFVDSPVMITRGAVPASIAPSTAASVPASKTRS